MTKALNVRPGDVFNRLTLIKEVKQGVNNKRRWEAKCVCGSIGIYALGNLKSSHTRSCGCLQREKATKWETSGEVHKRALRNRWLNMKNRCTNPLNRKYPIYGARGISVCKRWQNFVNFYEDMVKEYKPGLSLDRINNNKGYSPSNCRWSDNYTQNQNRRTSIFIHGKCITTACREAGVNYDTLRKLRRQNPNEKVETLFDSLAKK